MFIVITMKFTTIISTFLMLQLTSTLEVHLFTELMKSGIIYLTLHAIYNLKTFKIKLTTHYFKQYNLDQCVKLHEHA